MEQETRGCPWVTRQGLLMNPGFLGAVLSLTFRVASGVFLLKACGAVRRGCIHEVGVPESFMVIGTS